MRERTDRSANQPKRPLGFFGGFLALSVRWMGGDSRDGIPLEDGHLSASHEYIHILVPYGHF